MQTQSPKRTVILNALRSCRLFQDLSPHDLERIADTCVISNLERDEYLFHENEPAFGFYIVTRGAINVHRVSPGGKEKVISIFRPYEPFAEITLTTVETYPADARAIEPSTVILVRKRDFRRLIMETPELALRMLTSMSFHLKYLVQMIEDLQFRQIESRLANWFIRQVQASPGDGDSRVTIDTSKKLLASQLGVTSETFSRTLAKFRDRELIDVHGNEVVIRDIEGLREFTD